MRRAPLALARALALALLAALVLAGCLQKSDDGLGMAGDVKEDAAAAGAVAGPAPAAPQEPYKLRASDSSSDGSSTGGVPVTVTAYPLKLPTSKAKPPVALELSGAFNQTDCAGAQARPLTNGSHFFDLAPYFEAGDVYAYNVTLRYANTEEKWAEIHLGIGFDATEDYNLQPYVEERGVIEQNFTGQGYHADETARTMVSVDCWYGNVGSGIAYALVVELSFAEGGVPSQSPFLVEVPHGAERLFVRGVPIDPAEGVLSHYRVFAPDDSIVCECALSSAAEAATLRLPGPGAYVVLVDHTTNGFVSLALDAPPTADLKPLAAEWIGYPVVDSEGEAKVVKDALIDIPTVPLQMFAFVAAPERASQQPVWAGGVYEMKLSARNARGEVLRESISGYLGASTSLPMLPPETFVPVPSSPWEFFTDHHAFAPGPHQVHVEAEALRGVVILYVRQYVR